MSALHQQAKDLFLAALARPASERPAFLARACGTDAALRAEVESLLEFHASSHGSGDLVDSTRPPMPPKGVAPPRDAFKPGDIFAKRYRMVTRIGRGGMGDVWRVDDLVLDTPVALKLIRTTGRDARERILNEVRLARQITHPAVCRVFDVGSEDDAIFYSMELVQGEDLASLLRRVGRLPPERVLEISRQLSRGLAAAHARGVLHRDLKPANVLIDEDGQVKITDFGIAVLREADVPHAPMGTLGYMAPEQLTPGAPLTERTDLYALGLILYELIVGQHPFNHTQRHGVPTRPAALIPEISPTLDRGIMKALCAEPADRPASASELLGIIDSVPVRSRRWWPAAVAAIVVLAAGLGLAYMRREAARPLTAQDTIVLADFTNTTGEPVFDGTLKVALAVALEQSPFLKVFPDDRVRDTLRLMDRSPDEAVTRAIAREIAQREQLKALLTGSIAGLGRNYVLALEAVNAQTGDVMAREQVEATSKEEVLTVLGGAAVRLREKLGESLASIQKFDVPLARATTPSLAALNAYSLALDQGTINPRPEALPHLRRAIELDPEFALALALTATVYSNYGQSAIAAGFAKKAFDLRDRVSERERFFISFRYYRDATQDWARALELTRLWTTTYTREAFAFNSFGTALSRFGEQQQAVAPFREAIRLDPRFAAPYSNLATSLIALNRYDDAKAVLQDAVSRRLDFVNIRRLLFTTAFIEGDAATMKSNFDATLATRDATAYGWQAHVSAFDGAVKRAHEEFRSGIQMALQADLKEVAGQIGVEDGEVHAIVGQCGQARGEINEALQASRDNFTIERAARALALCGVQDEVAALTRELAQRFPDATLTERVSVPVINAALALARHEPQRVLDILEPVRPYDRAPRAELWPAFLRGNAYLQLKDSRAAAEFQSILDHRGEDPDSQLHALASLGLARAYAAAADRVRAEASYQKMMADWKDGDPDLAPLKDARLELSKLH